MAFRQTPNPIVSKFQRLCHEYLKCQERERLVCSLRHFQRSRDVVELAETISALLNTPEKRSALCPVVYELIPVWCRRTYQENLQRKLLQKEDIQPSENIHNSFSSLTSEDSSLISNSVESTNTITIQKVIHLPQSPKGETGLGFKLCYSHICGPGFFINSLEPDFAEWSGLEVGDELVAVNDISVHNWQMNSEQLLNVVAVQRQQKVGVDIYIKRLMFNPQKLTTGGPCVIQDVCWYDISSMKFHRQHTPKWPSQLRHTRMKMKDSNTGRMGLNIRGGREFNSGIYISKIEREGLADRCGLRVGDQILTVNEISLVDIPYREACRNMAYEETLDFVLRYTGQFPVYMETPQNLPTSTKTKGGHYLHDSSFYRTMENNYPYTNGRVDPIGSCSPGTIHSYKIADSSDDDVHQKRLYTEGAPCIQNPLCGDESSLLGSLPNSPSSEQTSANDLKNITKAKNNNNYKVIQTDWLDEPPKPPPRTGKLDLEKLNKVLSKKNTALKHNQSYKVSQEYSHSQSSKVEVETTAIVHQPAEGVTKQEIFKNGDSPKPNDQKIFRRKPPRKNKNKEINRYDEKSASESKNETYLLRSNTDPTYTTPLKIEPNNENLQLKLIEQEECPKQTLLNEITCSNIPAITVDLASADKPEKITDSDSSGFTKFAQIEPYNFMKPEVTMETELLPVQRTGSPTHDDDDRLSYISSMSLDFNGENFLMKWSLSEEESIDSNDIHSSTNKKINQPENMASTLHDENYPAEDAAHSHQKSARKPSFVSPEIKVDSLEVPPIIKTPDAMPANPALNPIDKEHCSRPKQHTENSRFQNAVIRTINNNNSLAATKFEDSENKSFQMMKRMAEVILTKEEIRRIIQYINEYTERNDVEYLVNRLLVILNNPEKQLLLNQIRELVSPFDRGRFDSMLSIHENTHFQNPFCRRNFNEKGDRGLFTSQREDHAHLARVNCRRKQLDAQMELLENLKNIKPKIYKHKEEDMNLITVYVSKTIRTLGISVTGGIDCKRQPAIIIEEIHPGGAAAETKRIKPGMCVVSVDDEDIETASHRAAVYVIRKAFNDRKKPCMKLVLRKQIDVER